MQKTVFFLIAVFFLCCNNPKSIHQDNSVCKKFKNYISLEGKVFKNGDVDFYPMILNYSVDAVTKKRSPDNPIYATPKNKYHPFYGDKEGESMNPWGKDEVRTHAIVQEHFHNIKKMGFNAIRLTGLSTTESYGGFHTWDSLDVSNSTVGNHNIEKGVIPLLELLLDYAENAGLRIVLLLSAIENQPNNQYNYYIKIAEALANRKALLAYDIYNEPVYFDRGKYSKHETQNFVKNYNHIIKSAAPNQLTTIGLTHYKIVSEWDPELMDVDFLSFHIYPYWSKHLSLLERFESKLYWISKNISKPWIVGETGLNTMLKCDPPNLATGTISDQLAYMKYSLEACRSAGASGYSWWNYQDSRKKLTDDCPDADHYGLVSRKKRGSYEDGHIGEMKHPITDLPFTSFLKNSPYKTSEHANIKMPPEEHYYNIDYLPARRNTTGKIIDEFDNPVEDAIITVYNPISKTQYSTFSKPDGTFDLKTGWTNLFDNLDFILQVAAVKKKTIEIPIREVYNRRKSKETKLKDIKMYNHKDIKSYYHEL